jgi:hypothetical protein
MAQISEIFPISLGLFFKQLMLNKPSFIFYSNEILLRIQKKGVKSSYLISGDFEEKLGKSLGWKEEFTS